ncbi:MAG: ABC transporter permease [Halorhodospira sp.]
MSARRASPMRLRGLVRKELLQIVRDPSAIAIAFLLPAVLLILFGYGVSLDAEDVQLGIVTEDPSAQTTAFTAGFTGSRYFHVHHYARAEAAQRDLARGAIDGLVHLRADFAAGAADRRPAPIQLLVNGVDANTARIIQGYVQGVWSQWLTERAGADEAPMPVDLEQRVWFNPEVRSRNYLVPGLIVVIMTLIGTLLTAMIMAREWERGTMEALLVTPVSMAEIIAGKLLPYFLLGAGGMALSTLMALSLFEVPLRGSLLVLSGAAALFLLVALAMGLLISILAKDQFVAGQAAIVATFLPAFMLSGFIFDLSSMPWPIEGLTFAIAARYFVAILQTVFLAGDVWAVILPNALALAAMGLVLLLLIRRRAHKRLE